MTEKILLFLCCFSVGALSFGWWTNRIAILDRKEEKIKEFVNAGPRFTAKDGQELCERVAFLERQSIGFRKSGTIQKPCLYYPK